MGMGGGVSKIRAFFRAGYPTGMPAYGYVPLVALLPRRLTNDEISTVTGQLITLRRRPVSATDIGVEVTKITREMPSPTDIERVQRRLEAI
jgi:Protein of unknown function (DUF3349)